MEDLIITAKRCIMLFFKKGYYKYVLAIVAYFLIKSYMEKSRQGMFDRIKENMSMGKAQLIKITPRSAKVGEYLYWKVYIDTFIFERSIMLRPGQDYRVKPGIWAPVVYITGCPQTFEIIWNRSLFSEFNIPIPDSLEWAKVK